MGMNLENLSVDHVEVTDSKGGERLSRFNVGKGELIIGDIGYAHRAGLHWVVNSGGDFLIRLNWSNVPLLHADESPFDILGELRGIPDAQVSSFKVIVKEDKKRKIPQIPARLVATPKTEAAAQKARKKAIRERSKKGGKVDPRTLEAANYIFVLTTLGESMMPAGDILELYRFRWQIELMFKHLKSLMFFGDLRAKDPPLTKLIINTRLLAALMLDDLTESYLAFSPWGYRH
jgi:hypothetical protein